MENNTNEYDFEIYTTNPETGETGWDIKFIRVYATDRKTARTIVSTFPNYDCVITSANGGKATGEGRWIELDSREYGG